MSSVINFPQFSAMTRYLVFLFCLTMSQPVTGDTKRATADRIVSTVCASCHASPDTPIPLPPTLEKLKSYIPHSGYSVTEHVLGIGPQIAALKLSLFNN